MEKKTTKILAVIVTTLLCGLPGFIGTCMSLMALLGASLPDSGIPRDEVMLVFASSATILGMSLICAVIPIGVGSWAWWSHKKEIASIAQVVLPEEDF